MGNSRQETSHYVEVLVTNAVLQRDVARLVERQLRVSGKNESLGGHAGRAATLHDQEIYSTSEQRGTVHQVRSQKLAVTSPSGER